MNNADLEIRVHLCSGKTETFTVTESAEAERILSHIIPGKFFEQRQIVIGCRDSLTAFPTEMLTQVEFISDKVPEWSFHHNVRMITEVRADEFREKYAHQQREDRSLTDVVHVASEIELTTGELVFLTLEINSDPAISPLTPLDQHQFIQQLFASTGIHARRREGGVVLINPAHIARLTMHPGPDAVPTGAWKANGC